jgi:hypothetical protein
VNILCGAYCWNDQEIMDGLQTAIESGLEMFQMALPPDSSTKGAAHHLRDREPSLFRILVR